MRKKNKNEEKQEKEKALGAHNKQHKQRCCKCGKYSHKSGDLCLWRIKKTMKIMKKQKK